MYGFVQKVYIIFLFLLELFVLREELCTFVVVGVASLKIMVLRRKEKRKKNTLCIENLAKFGFPNRHKSPAVMFLTYTNNRCYLSHPCH